jgi:hypothetical protein
MLTEKKRMREDDLEKIEAYIKDNWPELHLALTNGIIYLACPEINFS